MSTDVEKWQENSGENANAGREESRSFNREYRKVNYNRENGEEGRSYRSSPNRYNNDGGTYNREERPRRPRFVRSANNESGNGGAESRPRRPRIGGGNNSPAYHSDGNSGYRGGERQGGGYRNNQRSYNPNFRNNNQEQRQWRSNSYDGNYNNEPNGNRWDNGEERPRQNYRRQNNGGYNNNRGNSYGQGSGYRQQGQGNYRPQGGNARPRRTADYDPNAKYSKKKQFEYKDVLTDPNEPIRLNKFLANAGVCSRREADEFITAGVVSVNGVVVTELGTKIKRSDEVKFHDQPVNIERKVYVLLNKPKDCVTTSDDPHERKTVMDCVRGACKERIYPVGRLDRNTTGVLLLTNDGDLASKLTHPKYLKKKIYHVYCDKNVTKADMDQIVNGITLEDGEIHADAISYASDTDKSQVGIEIHSGKNRIVRRIFESLGYKVVKLDRVFFAGLTKKNLRRGQWRYLTEKEVNMLRMGAFE